jgi:hypothetical protein
MALCFGKLPARTDAITFKFADFLSGTKVLRQAVGLPDLEDIQFTPPMSVGMYGNDQYGDCVLAGGGHEEVRWAREHGEVIGFRTADLLQDFTAITGKPPSPTTGADMQMAASYRRRVGLLDANGIRRKVAAYVEIQPGNINELYLAIKWFKAVGIGIRVLSTLMSQFSQHQSWHIVGGERETGEGHYIPGLTVRGGNFVVATWARLQAVRPSYLLETMDEGIAYVSDAILSGGKSPDGFDAAGLLAKLQSLPSQ